MLKKQHNEQQKLTNSIRSLILLGNSFFFYIIIILRKSVINWCLFNEKAQILSRKKGIPNSKVLCFRSRHSLMRVLQPYICVCENS